jgi:hypothetical protein
MVPANDNTPLLSRLDDRWRAIRPSVVVWFWLWPPLAAIAFLTAVAWYRV